ncbi:plasminogen-binding N-terminal domain-containing protein [Campylobacter sp. RM12654]|uniref:plasminogen-binding N-terminal domain-containing protein n=1 Tax=unclassified Campylobacter TaxID=2593542 RepID=UPI001D60A87E|nr:plasminogen-binding N-terminal domain-containing protein [Campylobacter sp. RM12651]MBZ7977551.1 plasminogen-binding N-terminal domain-containing protein [Campylobacter sp. RM12654]MBZ7983044.1 plasminogen-binding N-terminal domain-containing protein [Campylobacter sp. RM12647]ULO03717.1 putative plasminogen-binding protein [Campylobacter sp. RM12651]
MFKKTFILICFSVFAFANQFINAVIDKIDNGYAYAHIVDAKYDENNLKNGAIVIKDIGEYSIIVARASFVNNENNNIKLELYTFSDLKQDALPLPILTPQIGDRVIFNNYIEHTLLIAPSQKIYDSIKNKYNNFIYFDTNVLAANLYAKKQLTPNRNDLREFCRTWAIGSVMVVLKNNLYLYECSSLKKIAELDNNLEYNQIDEINFYSNISKQLSKTTDYFSYYNKLFKEKE